MGRWWAGNLLLPAPLVSLGLGQRAGSPLTATAERLPPLPPLTVAFCFLGDTSIRWCVRVTNLQAGQLSRGGLTRRVGKADTLGECWQACALAAGGSWAFGLLFLGAEWTPRQQTWVQVQVLPLTNCVTLEPVTAPQFSVKPQFPLLCNGAIDLLTSRVAEGLKRDDKGKHLAQGLSHSRCSVNGTITVLTMAPFPPPPHHKPKTQDPSLRHISEHRLCPQVEVSSSTGSTPTSCALWAGDLLVPQFPIKTGT